MSTDVTTKQPQLPDQFKGFTTLATRLDTIRDTIEANVGAGGLTQFNLDRIKAPSGGAEFFSIPSIKGPKPADSFEGIVVYWKDARAYWSKPLSQGGNSPPDCTSDDGITGVGDPGGDCRLCPFAQFGSKLDEKGNAAAGQACRAIRPLFVLRPGAILPIVVPAPPTSQRAVQQYFLRLVNEGLPYWRVLTKFKLEKASSRGGIAYARIIPELVEVLPDDLSSTIEAYRAALMPQLRVQRAQSQDFAQ